MTRCRPILESLRAVVATSAILVLLVAPGPVALFTRYTTEQIAGGPGVPVVPGIVSPDVQLTMVQWAMDKGGAYVVILLLLFFMRRDWHTTVDYWQAQNAITTDLVIRATQAQTDTAAALRENTVVVHATKRVIMTYVPANRRLDDLGPDK